jgi:hypothetical protein
MEGDNEENEDLTELFLSTCNEAREAFPKRTIPGSYLEMMSVKYKPGNYFEKIKAWKSRERIEWFKYMFSNGSIRMSRPHLMAKEQNEVDTLLAWYEEYQQSDYVRSRSGALVFVQAQLVQVYRYVTGDAKMAKDLCYTILDSAKNIRFHDVDGLEAALSDV